jgi:hypothetical protein
MSEQEYVVVFDVLLVKQTDNAGLFEIEAEAKRIWLPWSQLDEGSIDTDGQVGSIYLAKRLAWKHNLT